MIPIKITRNGILKLLLNIDPNKAVGPDQIPGHFLKLCTDEIADMYIVLFQASLDQGIVLPDWKIANIGGPLIVTLDLTYSHVFHSAKTVQ